MSDDPFKMPYCDTGTCRVNTFEQGKFGDCPGCARLGLEVPT